MRALGRRLLLLVLLAGGAGWIGWRIHLRLQEDRVPLAAGQGERRPAPVEVAPIVRGPIALRRTFSGALEARAAFVVAPKVAGRIARLTVDIADPVERGEVVAWLDDDEHVQAVTQVEADLAVARAHLSAARSALEISERVLERVETLLARTMASESELDVARADQLAKRAQLDVAEAQVRRAEAELATARIRLGYTRVTADWTGGDDRRVVAERFVDEGETVGANTPLLAIVALEPIVGVVFVPERDYARLEPGQPLSVTTDGWPGEEFPGRIERIAPIFRAATRQARVELTIPNEDRRLKPGMFIRAQVVLERRADATIVPYAALTEREDRTGIFVVAPDGRTAAWRDVAVGIREGERVEVTGEGLQGRVVTLGHQLVDDGGAITIPDEDGTAAALPGALDG